MSTLTSHATGNDITRQASSPVGSPSPDTTSGAMSETTRGEQGKAKRGRHDGHRRAASKQTDETDDITDDLTRAGTARTACPIRAMRNENGNTSPVNKQKIAAQPYNSGRNAQFRSQPELYKNDRKRDAAG